MTSEVVVMNRLAVALAADSASTVRGPDGREKIWNSANKLFALSRCEPVGVMFYNDASLAGVPWETLVKDFRSSTLGSVIYPTLQEYACGFIEYLKSNLSYFSEEAQDAFFLNMVKQRFEEIKDTGLHHYFEQLSNGKRRRPKLIEEFQKIIDPELDAWSKKDDLAVVGKHLEIEIPKLYDERVRTIVQDIFQNVTFEEETIDKLLKLATLYGTKADFENDYTGMVFAGFGRDLYPVVRHIKIGIVIAGRLRYTREKDYEVTDGAPSHILPFAQSEMVETFLHGVSPRIKMTFIRSCIETTTGLADVIVDAISDLTVRQKKKWKKAVNQHADEVLGNIVEQFKKFQIKHRTPIQGALIHLPKDEIANVAESLVNLNYFQKRVSMDSETVGGPIDVAVISKGDGFIWIKRKHYFSPELNPQFFMSLKKQFNGECDASPQANK
jgi:hypothetical protein